MVSDRLNWRLGIVLVTVVAVHFLCFYWWVSSDYFFSGDGLFYFSRKIGSLAEIWRRLVTVDELYQYRPLPYIVFSFVLYPLFGTSPTPYHLLSYLIASASALLACIAVYFWTGRDRSLTLLASVFLLLNPVNFFPSFGLDYIDVWLSIFFCNLALVLIITNSKSGRVLVPVLAVLALLAREHSVLLPIEAMLILVAMGLSFREAFSRTRSTWIVFGAYALLQLYARSGAVFADEQRNENLRFKFSVARLEELTKGFKPAIFFPENPQLNPILDKYRRPVRLAFVIPWFIMVVWAIIRRHRLAISALIWVPISLLPVAFIQMPPYPRHYWMALPGLAILFASFVRTTRFIVPMVLLLSTVLVTNVAMYAEQNYAVVGARLTKMYLGEIHRTADRTQRSDFYVMNSGDRYFQWHIDSGIPLRDFLRRDFSFRFASAAQPIAMDKLLANQVNVIIPRWEGISDAISTGQFPDYSHRKRCNLALNLVGADVPCAIFYRGVQLRDTDKVPAETPTGQPLFENDGQLVTLSRTTIFLRNMDNVRIAADATLAPESTDGIVLQVFKQVGNRFDELKSIHADPGERIHIDERLEASNAPVVVLRVSPGAMNDEMGDWLVWDRK